MEELIATEKKKSPGKELETERRKFKKELEKYSVERKW
jgi:hypothetical protein